MNSRNNLFNLEDYARDFELRILGKIGPRGYMLREPLRLLELSVVLNVESALSESLYWENRDESRV